MAFAGILAKVAGTGVAKEGGALNGIGVEVLKQLSEAVKGKTHIPAWVFGVKKRKNGAEPEGVDITNAWILAGLGALGLYALLHGKFPSADFGKSFTNLFGGTTAQGWNTVAENAAGMANDLNAGKAAKKEGTFKLQVWVDYKRHSLTACVKLEGYSQIKFVDGDYVEVNHVSRESALYIGNQLKVNWQIMDEETGAKTDGPGKS